MVEEGKKKEERSLVSLPEHIQSYLVKQWELPWQQQRQLINCSESLAEIGVQKAVAMSKAYHLPLDVIAMIPTKQGLKPYIMETGVVFRLQWDYRRLKSIIPEVEKYATKEDPEARVKCTVEFQDGSKFVNYSCRSSEDEPYEWTPGSITKKCVTSAIRRAGLTATGIPFPVWEELIEWEETKARKIINQVEETGVPESDRGRKLTEFLKTCYASGLNLETIQEKLGPINEITDFEEALKKLGLKGE